MTVIVRDATNTPRTISEIVVRDGANTPRTISEIWVRDSNNVSRLVYTTSPALSANASPNTVYGESFGTGSATTDTTLVTPSGGVPPYTYAWTLQFTSYSPDPTANAPTSAATDFTQTSLGPGDGVGSQWICTVTDDVGQTAQTIVAANFQDLT